MYHCWKCGKAVELRRKHCNNIVNTVLGKKKCNALIYVKKRPVAKINCVE